jgi:PAP2 superfamily
VRTISFCGTTALSPRRSRSRYAWAGEVAFVATFYVAYETLRAFRHPSARVAVARARTIAGGEAWLHLNFERALNTFTTAHTALAEAAGYYYATLHFLVTPVVLGWLWWRHQGHYRRWRTILAVATVGGLAIYWLVPVAPPRLTLHGMTDTLVARNIFGAANPHGVTGLVNLYAAMPSLHVGWAFWVAMVVFRASPWRRVRWLALIYPVATTIAVVATANHFVADAAAGVVLVLLAWAVVSAGCRVRRALTTGRALTTSTATGEAASQPVAGDAPQLVRVGDQVDPGDQIVDDGEPDHADQTTVGCEHRTRLTVDDGRYRVRSEPRCGLQHPLGHRLGADDGKSRAGDSDTDVGAEHDVWVEHLQQAAHVTGAGCGEKGVHDLALPC